MTTYEMALEKSREASRLFRVAQEAYRARTIDDEAYLSARRLYSAAMAEFDQAFALEAGWHGRDGRA